MNREELLKEIKQIMQEWSPYNNIDTPYEVFGKMPLSEIICDFVIADRKRIVQPLVNFKETKDYYKDMMNVSMAIAQTLHLALGKDKENIK